MPEAFAKTFCENFTSRSTLNFANQTAESSETPAVVDYKMSTLVNIKCRNCVCELESLEPLVNRNLRGKLVLQKNYVGEIL
jgi:hypothetical protein